MAETSTLKVNVDLNDPAGVFSSNPDNQAVKPGVASSEYAVTVAGGWWGAVLMVMGVLVAGTETIVNAISGVDSHAGQVAGSVMALVGMIYRLMLELRFIRGRSEVKAATATGAAQVAVAKITGTAPATEGTTTTTTTETGGAA